MKNQWMPASWANKWKRIPVLLFSVIWLVPAILVLVGCEKNLPEENLGGSNNPKNIPEPIAPKPFQFTDSRDGKTYLAARLGDQTWMLENLAYLPAVSPPSTGSLTEKLYYVYDFDGTNVELAKSQNNFNKFGVLYNFEAARSSCPTGWHLPTDKEWSILIDYLAQNGYGYIGYGGYYLGKSLASTSGWINAPDVGSVGNLPSINNRSGFNALPAGIRFGYEDIPGSYYGMGYQVFFWSSTQELPGFAWGRTVDWDGEDISQMSTDESFGNSVRCVKDFND